jgi:hypothetical protein
MLAVNRYLQRLDVKHCQGLGITGVNAILNALKSHPCLRNLNGLDIASLKVITCKMYSTLIKLDT